MGKNKVVFCKDLDIIDEEQLVCTKCGGKFDKTNSIFWFVLGFLSAILVATYIMYG